MSVTRQMARVAAMLFVTLLPTLALAAARVTLEVNTTKVSLDDELRITVRASGSFDNMTEPEVEGWEIRRTGQQEQLSIIGGSMQQSKTLMYVATPSKAGTFKVGPVVLLDGSDVVGKSETLTVEVVAPRTQEQVATAQQATDINSYIGQAFFVHPSLSTNQPFVGQPFVVAYALYWSRQRAMAGIRPLAEPKYGNLEPENLRDDAAARAETIVLAGHPYQRQTTHRDLLVAPTPGPLRLEGPRFRIESLDSRAQKVAPPIIDLQVRPIPTEGRPAGFVDGNVGRLHIAATLQAAGSQGAQRGGTVEVQTGERLLLTVSVSGDGNLLGLKPPTLPQAEAMTAELLQKRDDAGVTRTANGVQGTRTWEWMLSFAKPGHMQLPQVAWTSFDPFQERFDAQTIGPFELEVRGEVLAPTATTATDGAAGQPLAVHARDALRKNVAEAKLAVTDGRSWLESRAFRALLALPWLVTLAVLVVWLRRRKQVRDAPERQRRAALAVAQARLKQVGVSEPSQGYGEARQVVTEYLHAVAAVAIGGLTEPAVVDELQRRGVALDVARGLAADLQHCDFGRFAPAGDRQSDLAQTTERLAQHLNHIDAALLRVPVAAAKAALALLAVAGIGLLPHPCHASTLDETFAAANQAYAQGHYEEAKTRYQALLGHDLPAAAVHYNLGNTLVQLGQLGRAVAQFQAALQSQPDPTLRADIGHNLQAVRAELTDRARRHHATLHIFDESASLDVIVAQAAPRALLGATALLAGLAAAGLLAWRLLGRGQPSRRLHAAIVMSAALHLLALAALVWADAVRNTLVQAVVVEEDAQLVACQSQGEADDLGLPEGLEVRMLAEMADGRMRVRLPNGREGCLPATALETEATPAR